MEHHYYYGCARTRKFDVGDEVLLLLPTDSNKLLLQWEDPYEVVDVVNRMNHKIDVSGIVSTYHVNMLKQYVERRMSCLIVYRLLKQKSQLTTMTMRKFLQKIVLFRQRRSRSHTLTSVFRIS